MCRMSWWSGLTSWLHQVVRVGPQRWSFALATRGLRSLGCKNYLPMIRSSLRRPRSSYSNRV